MIAEAEAILAELSELDLPHRLRSVLRQLGSSRRVGVDGTTTETPASDGGESGESER